MEWFSEKFIEDCIAEAPAHFLGRELQLIGRQPKVKGFIPDLLFRAADGETVVVEVQQQALDRHHLYKCLEYRDSLADAGGVVSIILFCEHMPEKYVRIAKTHNVDVRAMPRDAILELAVDHCPTALKSHLLRPWRDQPEAEFEDPVTPGVLRPYRWHEYDDLLSVYRYTIAELSRCGVLEKYRNTGLAREVLYAAESTLEGSHGLDRLADPNGWNVDRLLGKPRGWVPPNEANIQRIRPPHAVINVYVTAKNNLSVTWLPVETYLKQERVHDWVKWPAEEPYAYQRPENELLFIHDIYQLELDADKLMYRPDAEEQVAVNSMLAALIDRMIRHIPIHLSPSVSCGFYSEFCVELGDETPDKFFSTVREITGWRVVNSDDLRQEKAATRVSQFEAKAELFSVADMLAAFHAEATDSRSTEVTLAAAAKRMRASGIKVKVPDIRTLLQDMVEARDVRLAPLAGQLDIPNL